MAKSLLPRAVQNLAQELSRLPGIGPKTAQRLALYLLRQPAVAVRQFAETLTNLHDQARPCRQCFLLAEQELCSVCRDTTRLDSTICVVESSLDVDAIERTNSYTGRYHVLGGVLSPLEGIGPEQLSLAELLDRARNESVTELIIALGHTMEADATTRYIMQETQRPNLTISRLARGLPTGGDIEFTDTPTLVAAFEGRKSMTRTKTED